MRSRCINPVPIKPLSPSAKLQNVLVSIHFRMVLIGRICKDHSNFYLGIMSLILFTFSLDLCIDTVRRNLMLVALRVEY